MQQQCIATSYTNSKTRMDKLQIIIYLAVHENTVCGYVTKQQHNILKRRNSVDTVHTITIYNSKLTRF